MGAMSDALITLDSLREWTQEPITEDGEVTFATLVIEAASRQAKRYAGMQWVLDGTPAPPREVQDIVAGVCRRTFLNPDQETRTASIGPIGGSTYLDDFAAGLTFTDREIAALAKIGAEEGGSVSTGGGLWVQQIEHPQEVGLAGTVIAPMSNGSYFPIFDIMDPTVRPGTTG